MRRFNPKKSPLGTKAVDYGNLNIRLWFPDRSMDPWNPDIDALADSDNNPSLELSFAIAEHLMAAAAKASGKGFEHGIEEIVEKAKVLGQIEQRPQPNTNPTPKIGPSGESFPLYGEVEVHGWLDKKGAEEIHIYTNPTEPPAELLQAAAVRMLISAAWQSPEARAFGDKGFNAALDVFAEGANEARGKLRPK